MGWSFSGSFSLAPSTIAPISRPRNAYSSNCWQCGFGRNASLRSAGRARQYLPSELRRTRLS
eukprot:9474627-Pyramimonas_sp.AAC.1